MSVTSLKIFIFSMISKSIKLIYFYDSKFPVLIHILIQILVKRIIIWNSISSDIWIKFLRSFLSSLKEIFNFKIEEKNLINICTSRHHQLIVSFCLISNCIPYRLTDETRSLIEYPYDISWSISLNMIELCKKYQQKQFIFNGFIRKGF